MFDVPLDRFEDLVATALGEISTALGETSPALGETSPALGETSPALGETSPALGETSPALGETPGGLADRLEHLVVVISDAPSGAFSGLHEALPVGARRAQGTAAVAPDRITVHRPSLVDGCRTEAEVAARIRATLRAEITRVLELPDAEVRALGW